MEGAWRGAPQHIQGQQVRGIFKKTANPDLAHCLQDRFPMCWMRGWTQHCLGEGDKVAAKMAEMCLVDFFASV